MTIYRPGDSGAPLPSQSPQPGGWNGSSNAYASLTYTDEEVEPGEYGDESPPEPPSRDEKEPWRREGLEHSPCASPSKTIGIYRWLIAETVAMQKEGVAWE